MHIALRVIAGLAGATIVIVTLASAIKTVVIPRSAASLISRSVFLAVRKVYLWLAPPGTPFERRDRILSSYSPVGLVLTLFAWLLLTMLGYTLLFMAVEDVGPRPAFELSGTSLLTLGTLHPERFVGVVLVFSEAALGLFLLALLITYLPTIYSAYGRRELGVTALEVRAGSPPSGRELIWRHWQLQRIEELHDVWVEWERWFVDVEETHTSLPAVVFFRSSSSDHSWVTAAGAVLDGASLTLSSVEVPRDVAAEFCIRAGYLCLRRIADYFRFVYDPSPTAEDPISITREDYDAAIASLEGSGVPIKADRDQAWRDFAGWRVNYDQVLLALANITAAPPAEWSSNNTGDRTVRPRLFGIANDR